MPEPTTATVGASSALAAGLLGWLVKILIGRELKRVDEHLAAHAKAIGELQGDASTARAELSGVRESLGMMRNEQQLAHSQLRAEIGGVNQRLDRVLERMSAAPPGDSAH